MKKKKLLIAAAIIGFPLTLIIMLTLGWVIHLDRDISARLKERRFSPPVEIYSAPEIIRAHQTLPPNYLLDTFNRIGYRQRLPQQVIFPGDYSIWTSQDCHNLIQGDLPPELDKCLAFQARESLKERSEAHLQVVAMGPNNQVLETYRGTPPEKAATVELAPELFAQFYGDEPILRREIKLSQTPQQCKEALLAIEDAHFLEHGGVSIMGMFRALLANLARGRISQGGSTITQQLVKNYFLTPDRTFRRKVKEIAMAFLLESHESKEDILETYLNVIYMGQNGPFQIRGYGAAAEHYFGTDVENLNLSQCALMAAMVNSPGLFNPFTEPEHARSRRAKVIDRMVGLNLLNPEDAQAAKQEPLPRVPHRALTEPAPYFVDAVRKKLNDLGIESSDGLKVYTSLNIRAQEAAKRAVDEELPKLVQRYPILQKLRAAGKDIEVSFLSADNETGQIQALIGGRSYRKTQFNRAIDAKRQVGSVMKPFVFLTALENGLNGQPFTPLTLISDRKFTYKYQHQEWSPENYEGEFHEDVPAFYALAESLNSATGQLGLQIGLDNIVELAKRVGIESTLQPLPSLSLGAFELRPVEVLQAYTTLARLGSYQPLTLIISVEDLNGRELFRASAPPQQVTQPEATAALVGMMKQTIVMGTGRGVTLSGFTHPSAGKTGTTSDTKDAWFAGFTPYHTAIGWVGYDDNTPDGLTGAAGAVPLWTNYMKRYATYFSPDDFHWPENTVEKAIDRDSLATMGVELKDPNLHELKLIFVKGTE